MSSWRPHRRVVLQGLAGLTAAAALPAQAKPETHAFVAVGDWGRDGADRQADVARAMGVAAREADSRFVLSVGDNFYPAGVSSVDDKQWRTSFEDIYVDPALQTPWYVALGNHDYRGSPSAQVAYTEHSHRWRMPSRYYQVSTDQHGVPGLDLFVVDTTPMLPMHGEAVAQIVRGRVPKRRKGAQLEWLEEALARSQAPWKVVVGHHPIHAGGKHGGEPILIERLKPLLETYGVQAYLAGHDHILQHIRSGPVDYVITGGGSSAGFVRSVPGSLFKASQEGFAVFGVQADAMTLEFQDYAGRSLYSTVLPRQRA